jgi:hypothetical protein
MPIDAVRLDDPVAEGSNFTVITQDALTPRLCGQLFVSIKSVGFVPVKTIPDIPSEVVPGLDKVTFCGVLAVPAGCAPNVRLGAESVIAGVATVVPVNDTVCGLPLALSPRPSVAFFVPLVNGAKFIVKVQVPCGGMASPKKQALLPAGTIPKFPASLPVIEILDTFSVALPRLVTVTVWGALVVPTVCAANTNAVVEILAIGAGVIPTPVSGTVCTAPETFPELSLKLRPALNVPAADGVKETAIIQLSPPERVEVGRHVFGSPGAN